MWKINLRHMKQHVSAILPFRHCLGCETARRFVVGEASAACSATGRRDEGGAAWRFLRVLSA
ncbi:MAG TPA: hypothetical protein DEP05_05425 [Betaproteobacteria bacterium]|nr:hypothetical protein [Betaproteobacteria bacterium]